MVSCQLLVQQKAPFQRDLKVSGNVIATCDEPRTFPKTQSELHIASQEHNLKHWSRQSLPSESEWLFRFSASTGEIPPLPDRDLKE